MLDERSKLKADLEKTQSQLSTMSQSGDGEEIKELERRMQTVTMEMENVRKVSIILRRLRVRRLDRADKDLFQKL